jgi:hypothetical protein
LATQFKELREAGIQTFDVIRNLFGGGRDIAKGLLGVEFTRRLEQSLEPRSTFEGRLAGQVFGGAGSNNINRQQLDQQKKTVKLLELLLGEERKNKGFRVGGG